MDILKQLADTFLDWEAMGEVIPKMFAVGLPNTLVLAVISGIIGTLLGMALALMGISRNAAARWIARIYTDVLRGLPPVLTILVIGFGFGPIIRELTGSTSPYPMAIAALSLMSGAYIGEIFRSGIQSVDKGQLEASRALGFGYGASMRLVVVPQGIRRVLPALVNQFIALIKESSLVFLLGPAGHGTRDLPDRQGRGCDQRQPLALCGCGSLLPGTHDSAHALRELD
ncbi:hypothetical protein StoSoilB13_14790 [Arthrobacter sp. StoSoilB13]|nr:hypothetical protein StoSoilB13_14790 [Arthrobacter sp. StoSoilB13]